MNYSIRSVKPRCHDNARHDSARVISITRRSITLLFVQRPFRKNLRTQISQRLRIFRGFFLEWPSLQAATLHRCIVHFHCNCTVSAKTQAEDEEEDMRECGYPWHFYDRGLTAIARKFPLTLSPSRVRKMCRWPIVFFFIVCCEEFA